MTSTQESPTANPSSLSHYDSAIIVAVTHYSELMENWLQAGKYQLPKAFKDNHVDFKAQSVNVYNTELEENELEITESHYLKRLDDDIARQYNFYKTKNDQTLHEATKPIYFPAIGIYEDEIKTSVGNCENPNNLLTFHRDLKAKALKYFADSKISGNDLINAEYEQKLDQNLEDIFNAYKTLLEFKINKEISDEENQCALIGKESLNIYQNIMDDIKQNGMLIAKEDLENEDKKARLDAEGNFRRRTRNANIKKDIIDKFFLEFNNDLDTTFKSYAENNEIATTKYMSTSENKCLSALIDSQNFYIKLMENVVKSKAIPLNYQRFTNENEKFKKLVKSNFLLKVSSATEIHQKKYEKKLDEYFVKMFQLLANIIKQE